MPTGSRGSSRSDGAQLSASPARVDEPQGYEDILERTPSGAREHLPAIVLIAGLIAVWVLVKLTTTVSLPQLHFMHSDAVELHDVTKLYVEAWDSPGFDPFATGAIRLATALGALVYFVSVTSLGSLVIGALPGSARGRARRACWPASCPDS